MVTNRIALALIKMKNSEEQKWQIISLLKQGYSRRLIVSKLAALFPSQKFHLSFVNRTIKRYQESESISDLPRSGRPKSARNNRAIKMVKSLFDRSKNSKKNIPSARKAAIKLAVSDRSVRRILHEDLGLHAYRLHRVQELTDSDKERRKTLSIRLLASFPDLSK